MEGNRRGKKNWSEAENSKKFTTTIYGNNKNTFLYSKK